MSEEEVIVIDTELCDSCEAIRTAVCYMTQGEKLEEWACIGNIIQKRDENDIHDQLNTIRLCVLRENGKITAHEWTPWEASVISSLATDAVMIHLEEGQPTVEHVNELIKLGYTDQNVQSLEDTEE